MDANKSIVKGYKQYKSNTNKCKKNYMQYKYNAKRATSNKHLVKTNGKKTTAKIFMHTHLMKKNEKTIAKILMHTDLTKLVQRTTSNTDLKQTYANLAITKSYMQYKSSINKCK